MFCPNCGTQAPEGSSFCPKCGVNLGTSVRKTPPPFPTDMQFASAQSAKESKQLSKLQTSGSGAGVAIAVVAIVFIGIAFMGIIAAIAIPNFLSAIQRSKQKRSMADIRAIATACEAYGTDNNAYPNVSTFEELIPKLEPKYIKTLPRRDAWENQFRYEAWNEKDDPEGEGPTIMSLSVTERMDRRMLKTTKKKL